MTRLDRKEYKCNHCGAVTVISDTDAEHLEQLLRQMMYRPAAQPAYSSAAATRKNVTTLGLSGLVIFLAILIIALLNARHGSSATTSTDSYFAQTTVPADRLTMSPLEWVPDGDGGSYVGVVYNHSGYAVAPPFYSLVLFHGGIKDGGASSIPLLGALEPGEYMPVSFEVHNAKPDTRYEVVQPKSVERNTREIAAPVALQQQIMVRQPHLPNYYLVGYVQNTLKRTFGGGGSVFLYDKAGRLIGSGHGNVEELNPGEKTKIVMNAWLFDTRSGVGEVASYEYLLDMDYKNERQSVSVQDLRDLGAVTVPNRIARVSNPRIVVAADAESIDPASFLQDQ